MKKSNERRMLTIYILVNMTAIATVYTLTVYNSGAHPLILASSFIFLSLLMWVGISITIYFFKNDNHSK